MSSDWNGPGNSWQDTPNANWTQSPDLAPSQHEEDDYPLHAQQEQYAAYASEADNFLDASFLPEQDVPPDNQETDEGESEDAAGVNSVATPDNWRKQLWQYVTLIVFPLLFFGVASLLVLPPIATGHAYLPPAFWFIVVVFLGIAIGQGVAVHFSAPHHNMWILGTVGGFILFLLFGVFALAGPLPATLLLLAILGGCIYLARRCIHSIPDDFVDIIYVAGKYERTLYTGLNLIWPWEQIAHQVKIKETHWRCNPQTIQLSPEEDVTLRADISYQVVPEDAHLAVTQISNWEESLRNLFETTLQTISTYFKPTDFLAWPQSLHAYQAQTPNDNPQNADLPDESQDDFSGSPARRQHINRWLLEQIQEPVSEWGVQINWVRIRDIDLAPHTLAGIRVTPIIPDYTKTANDDDAEKVLVGITNHKQQNVTQSVDTHGNSSSPDIHEETTEVLPPASDLPLSSQKIYTEDQLKKAYEAVQNGSIKDPLYIRQIAGNFDAFARNPEAYEKASFDPRGAAENLRAQAKYYEKLQQ